MQLRRAFQPRPDGFDGESEQQSFANLDITGIQPDSMSMNFGN
jgi:hypothetical protein